MSIIGRLVQPSIEKGIEAGVKSAAERVVPELVENVLDALWRNPAYPVIAGGQCLLMERGIEPKKAWEMSRECLVLFLKEEKVKFGHPDYGWGPEEGRALVQAYEIDYWESRP